MSEKCKPYCNIHSKDPKLLIICKYCNKKMPEESFCNAYEEYVDFEERCLFCAMKYVEELLDEPKK